MMKRMGIDSEDSYKKQKMNEKRVFFYRNNRINNLLEKIKKNAIINV